MSVHNHGPREGRGLDCPEKFVNGHLKGGCYYFEDVFCDDCGTLMILTGSGHQCPVEDWHDRCSLLKCGYDRMLGQSCGLREGYERLIVEADHG